MPYKDKERQKEYLHNHYKKYITTYKERAKLSGVKLKDRNKKLAIRYKTIVGCLYCGLKHPAALEFHHLDPLQKEFELSRVKAVGYKKFKEEIRKCIVLCSNCHRIEHYNLRNF